MTMKHWVNDGMIFSKFLFTPIGYSKVARYLDDPDLRQHARGSTTGELMGNRFYYTHYPAGYLVPYGVLAKFGFESRYWFRFLAILFSLSALTLMYAFFCYLSSRLIAFIATLYYAGSTMFLGIADSLANQPVDDFFRFLILLLSILAVRCVDNVKKYRIYNIAIWTSYFLLASSSYDSTFFVFVWLVGLDIITFRKLLWKKWLVLASAPVLAFVVQIVQNIWYLGFWDAWLDIYGSFRARANTGPGSNVFEKHFRSIFAPLVNMADLRVRFIAPITASLLILFYKFKDISYKWPKLNILALLLVSSFAYPFILVSSGYFPYQGRQVAPFLGLLVATATVLVFKYLFNFKILKEKSSKSLAVGFVLMVLLVGGLWLFQAKRTISFIKEWPNNVASESAISLGNFLKQIKGDGDGVVFKLDKKAPYRYTQIDPVEEYYIDMPVLTFKNLDDLVVDLRKLKDKSVYEFKPIILVETNDEANSIRDLIGEGKELIILIQSNIK